LPANRGFFVFNQLSSPTAQQKPIKMNEKYRRVPAEFGPETRFEISPTPPAPFRAVQENHFERLKLALLSERLRPLTRPELIAQVRRVANETAALAWVTPYHLLVFPVLFAEAAEAIEATGFNLAQRRQPAGTAYAYEATTAQ
jgi:hypothetical protein